MLHSFLSSFNHDADEQLVDFLLYFRIANPDRRTQERRFSASSRLQACSRQIRKAEIYPGEE